MQGDTTQINIYCFLKILHHSTRALPTYFAWSRCSLTAKSIYMSGSKKLGYQGVCVLWMNFQVCNETRIQWHFKLKEEESRQPCMWLLSASAKETPPPWPAVSQRSTTASAKAMAPACSPTWISSSKTCVWQQQSSETAAARNGAIAPQRCHWTGNRHSVTAIRSELARANFCRKPKAVEQKLLQGSRAQQSCQAALVKALLTQELLGHSPLHNKCT